jgi:3-phenylpropionate/trans-cinnamate dioxygenase ferredoxin subunit
MTELPEEFVPVAKAAEIAPGRMVWVAVERERIVVANVDGAFYALRDMCGHKNAPLSRGRLEGCLIECPLHFAKFDMRTGKLVDGPVSADVPCYETRVGEDGLLYLKRPAPPR